MNFGMLARTRNTLHPDRARSLRRLGRNLRIPRIPRSRIKKRLKLKRQRVSSILGERKSPDLKLGARRSAAPSTRDKFSLRARTRVRAYVCIADSRAEIRIHIAGRIRATKDAANRPATHV